MSKKNILAVDDEELLVLFIKDFLECYGYTVEISTNASQALDIFHADKDRFDLLITDQTMPDMTGLELIKEVRAFNNDMPIILCSGYKDVIDESTIAEYGVSYYLQKPVNNAQLLKNIEQLLA